MLQLIEVKLSIIRSMSRKMEMYMNNMAVNDCMSYTRRCAQELRDAYRVYMTKYKYGHRERLKLDPEEQLLGEKTVGEPNRPQMEPRMFSTISEGVPQGGADKRSASLQHAKTRCAEAGNCILGVGLGKIDDFVDE